jgi:3-oxoacyl-[acyl-carrier-protein] synthase II
MMEIFITGIGWVNPSGMGNGREKIPFIRHQDALPSIPSIKRHQLFTRGFKHFGRLDHYSRVGLAGITHALADAGLANWQAKRDIGMAVVSEWGCLATDLDYHCTVIDADCPSPSPALFSYTLPNSFLGEAAVYFGLTGPSYTLTDPTPSNLFGVKTAMDLLLTGQVGGMLAGQCDVVGPCDLPLPAAVTPQCIIFMLETENGTEDLNYGRLEFDANRSILVNNQPVHNLTALASCCLENMAEFH